jgi:hypothetical protein
MVFVETRLKGGRWDLIEGVAGDVGAAEPCAPSNAHNLCNLLLTAAFATLGHDLLPISESACAETVATAHPPRFASVRSFRYKR